jgi:hypothetical protein
VSIVWKEERLLSPLPTDEHRREHNAVEHGRYRVGGAETDVQHIGGHRAEHADADDRQPVRPRDITPHRKLQGQGHDEPEEPRQTAITGSIAWTL